MAITNLGRLTRVDLRQVWLSEAGHFTPWLAQEENLRLLGETIGIELELESQEKEVGPFRADILCKDTTSENWVLIENQLERTDHTHLGQLLTYAAGLNAVTIVWIAETFTPEHRAALDWLNEHTDEKINLFGLEVELWRIGDSPIAPQFNVISQPNDWARTVQKAAAAGDVTPHRQLQLEFWTAYREFMESKRSPIRFQKPQPQSWTAHPLGRSGAVLVSAVSLWSSETGTRGPEVRAEVELASPIAKQEFALLFKAKAEIEASLGFPLVWYDPPEAAKCRIYVKKDTDFSSKSLWTEQFEWLRVHLEALHRVFAPMVQETRRQVAAGDTTS